MAALEKRSRSDASSLPPPPSQAPSQAPQPPAATAATAVGGLGYDLIVLCDVLPYVGDLTPLFTAARRAATSTDHLAATAAAAAADPAVSQQQQQQQQQQEKEQQQQEQEQQEQQRQTLRSGGSTGAVIALSVEAFEQTPPGHARGSKKEATSYALRGTGRYAHSRAYVAGALRAAGFRVLRVERRALRRQKGVDVIGFLVVAQQREEGDDDEGQVEKRAD